MVLAKAKADSNVASNADSSADSIADSYANTWLISIWHAASQKHKKTLQQVCLGGHYAKLWQPKMACFRYDEALPKQGFISKAVDSWFGLSTWHWCEHWCKRWILS